MDALRADLALLRSVEQRRAGAQRAAAERNANRAIVFGAFALVASLGLLAALVIFLRPRGSRPTSKRAIAERGEPGQERLPVADEPRAADAAELGARLRPAAAARSRPRRAAPRARRPDRARRPAPAGADQRGARHLADRERDAVALARAGRSARGGAGGGRARSAAGRGARDRRARRRRLRRLRARRPPAAQAGAAQPALERDQVQPPRRRRRGRGRARERPRALEVSDTGPASRRTGWSGCSSRSTGSARSTRGSRARGSAWRSRDRWSR